ncbi:MAG: R3H domain-containing nucleic acid-binding protein [Candidatus Woesebacteria bacterium]|jgi:spoIIIJ-associated protein
MNNVELISTSIENIFDHLGISPNISIEAQDENIYNVFIEGDDLNWLIGYRGQSLEGLQTLLGLIALREAGEWLTIIVDINGYRNRKAERIEDLTKKLIDKVRFFEEEVPMPTMTPWERRQVHVLVSEYPDIESESTGEGRRRRVVLKPK